jgi:cytochrome P450
MITTTEPTYAATAPGPPAPFGWRGQSIAFLRDSIGFMARLYQRYGLVASWMAGNPWWLFAFGPEHNHQVLSDPARFNSAPIAPPGAPPDSALARLTYNLLSMNGAVHRQQRRLVLPAFHRKRVETYRDQMVALTARHLDAWRPGARLDLAAEMRRLTLCIASRTLFGLDAERDAHSVGAEIQDWMARLESSGVYLLPPGLPGGPFRRLLRRSDHLEERVRAMIDARRACPDGDDVLAMLLQARDEDGARLSESELIGQTSLVFVAGHETSSNALTWTLFLLAQHPQVAADLCDELAGELRGAPPTVEQLGRLPLLERVVKESLRLLPPAPFLVRVATAPFSLGAYHGPQGGTVTISPYLTHRLPELYDEPARFQPARWERLDAGTYGYLPFGAGPHMCLGATFALMEVRIVLAMILQRYRLAVVPGARIDRRVKITLSPRHGMPVVVHPADGRFAASRAPVRGNIHEMVDLAQTA